MRIMRNNVVAMVTGIFAVGSFSATRMMGADWPCFRGPNHDGISTEAIVWPKSGPRPVWKINVGIGHSALAVVEDRAYTIGDADCRRWCRLHAQSQGRCFRFGYENWKGDLVPQHRSRGGCQNPAIRRA